MDWFDFLAKVLPSLAIGSLAGTLLGGYLERKKLRTARRQELVDRWRNELLPTLDGTQDIRSGSAKYPFMRLPAYASLRPHLPADFIKSLEGKTLVLSSDGDFPRRRLREEIERIARQWQID